MNTPMLNLSDVNVQSLTLTVNEAEEMLEDYNQHELGDDFTTALQAANETVRTDRHPRAFVVIEIIPDATAEQEKQAEDNSVA